MLNFEVLINGGGRPLQAPAQDSTGIIEGNPSPSPGAHTVLLPASPHLKTEDALISSVALSLPPTFWLSFRKQN